MRLADFSRTQRRVILILMLVNFVNYVDRQIIFSLFPAIRRDFGLSFEQLGYLATAFTVVLALGSFPLGMLADRVSKRAVISAGVLFWSAATFFSGLAGSFRSLLAARSLVGVGEAAYYPAGAAVISASFPAEIRARVQGAFDIGMFFGGAVGLAVIGSIAWTVVNNHVMDSRSRPPAGPGTAARHAAFASPDMSIYTHALSAGVTAALTLGAFATVLALIVTLLTIRVRRDDLPTSPVPM